MPLLILGIDQFQFPRSSVHFAQGRERWEQRACCDFSSTFIDLDGFWLLGDRALRVTFGSCGVVEGESGDADATAADCHEVDEAYPEPATGLDDVRLPLGIQCAKQRDTMDLNARMVVDVPYYARNPYPPS
jgi:hypothetical protein